MGQIMLRSSHVTTRRKISQMGVINDSLEATGLLDITFHSCWRLLASSIVMVSPSETPITFPNMSFEKAEVVKRVKKDIEQNVTFDHLRKCDKIFEILIADRNVFLL